MTTLLLDRDLPLTRFSGRLWPVFANRVGMLSPVERLRLRDVPEAAELVYFHPDPTVERLASEALGAEPLRSSIAESVAFAYLEGRSDELASHFDGLVDSASLAANRVLEGAGDEIVADLELRLGTGDFRRLESPPAGVFVVGSAADVHVHAEAELFAGTVLDAREGPIVIDARAQVGQLSYVSGPSYIGRDTHVENCRLVAPVILGCHCRVAGEIEASIVGDFSNKHHEGFLGHSLVGRWVNIGALATTSDLKNNYGEVRLTVPPESFPKPGEELVAVSTESIKFGAIIADCVKIAIGLRIGSGTVLDVGSNVFGASPPKYLPPFSWGTAGGRYELPRFLEDCEKIFARRGQTPSNGFRDTARYYWESLAG
jgi:glucose-1-phosphate thymidylyltransferase